MRVAAILLMLVLPVLAAAQSSTVAPGELSLRVEVDETGAVPFAREMILVTIHGQYRRHITREALVQPDLAGFSWMQLGEDQWYDSRVDGLPVKNFRRRMALFADEGGTLEIGPFVHRLTLTDEGDDWFDHDLASAPVRIEVAPAPVPGDDWFPVRRLEIRDSWSNAPDQLQEGEGVLRVIHLEAVGASPEMLPPMPTLQSPSAMIFAHPERRFVDLSPEGPVAHAFWRWTIRPTNGTSGILEPMGFDYFDTVAREARRATITAQRVAMEAATLVQPGVPPPIPEGRLRPGWVLSAVSAALAAGLFAVLAGRRLMAGGLALGGPLDPQVRALRRAARTGDMAALRRAAHSLAARERSGRDDLLRELERSLFGPAAAPFDARAFARRFLRAEHRSSPR